MVKMKAVLAFLVIFGVHSIDAFLSVRNTSFYYGKDKVFLSGANIAWFNFARDFGSGGYYQVRSRFETAINEISSNGGNVIRVWVHTDGQWSPKWDQNGFATGEDTQSLIQELGLMLDYAASKNVFVILVLWNLDVTPQPMLHLYTEDDKLQAYLDRVLKPLVAGLKDKKALAAWDLVNEPMGSLSQWQQDPNPCYDTTHLKDTGAGWAGTTINYQNILKLINWHADAIKSVDPKALVTNGESGEFTTTTICEKCRDHYSDECLIGAGGRAKGTIDFYAMHSYTWEGRYQPTSPFKHNFDFYKKNKPFVVEEFSTTNSESHSPVWNYHHIYEGGFGGILSWQYNEEGKWVDSKQSMFEGMSSIRNLTSNGKIDIKL
uniref:Glycoside hydrolase family protein 5 n=1 Tax=Callosobruchus maculatus TaxID=64391 RepID=E7CIR1_CALMS|nr:glycoside hydrolase family protein 5 [Callosobruchus maculatus]